MLFRPLIALACALVVASCAFHGNKDEEAKRNLNSRVVETQRMRALDYGDVGSKRGAEMLIVDPDKTFDLGRSVKGSSRSYNAGSNVQMRSFNYDQKVTARSFNAGKFWGAKQSSFTDQRFATRGARTSGNYEIPNVTRQTATRTADTKDAREAGKTLAVRDLPGGHRPYLGKEAEKMKNGINPNSQIGWGGDLKEMSIEDLRELLNKNK